MGMGIKATSQKYWVGREERPCCRWSCGTGVLAGAFFPRSAERTIAACSGTLRAAREASREHCRAKRDLLAHPRCQDERRPWRCEHLCRVEAWVIEPERAHRIWPTVPLLRPVFLGGQVVHHHHPTEAQRSEDQFHRCFSLRAARWSFGWSGVEKEQIEIGENLPPVPVNDLGVGHIAEEPLDGGGSLCIRLDGHETGGWGQMRKHPRRADACSRANFPHYPMLDMAGKHAQELTNFGEA